MKIILLSGGSGKRLWPLSNDTRSKQFLPLLQAPDGSMESMVQRVLRQVGESDLRGAEVTIATNISQRDIIFNQLGNSVEVVTEPCRRDTFPAIALSCSHLFLEQRCQRNETVIVMPCDPYTEAGYFATVSKMARAIEENQANLVLMGITPTYPSEKFGYVVPAERAKEQGGAASSKGSGFKAIKVGRFTEKPTVEVAVKLLEEGALWNGGVFAFKLGYMVDIIERFIQLNGVDFQYVHSHYNDFPKISFDYQVAEKESSVAVVPFTGFWKDLGTWNTLTEEIPSNTIGNAHLGESNDNTHVINELGIPLFVDGMKDTIVAASPNGILVCSKEKSEGIKNKVESLSDRPMYEERRWGTYKVIDRVEYSDGFKALTKSITLKAGRNISYQVHHHRSEVWTFIDGQGLLVLDGKITKVSRGSVVNINKKQFHSVKALTDLTFIEVQCGDMLIEEDIERFDFDWNGKEAAE